MLGRSRCGERRFKKGESGVALGFGATFHKSSGMKRGEKEFFGSNYYVQCGGIQFIQKTHMLDTPMYNLFFFSFT